MATDTCELIRVRGFEIVSALAGLATWEGQPSAWRNRGNLDFPALPAVAWLDGGESVRTQTYDHGQKPRIPYSLMELEPQVILLEKPGETVENKGIGPLLAIWRTKIIKAFMLDAEDGGVLRGLLGEDGQIEYLGHDTDFVMGGTMRGALQVRFKLTYLFDPDDL